MNGQASGGSYFPDSKYIRNAHHLTTHANGFQIIDLEHASLHLSCPVIPIKAPLASLRQLQSFAEDPFMRLTEMMHAGLSHFTGRGLATIWSFIFANEGCDSPVFPFTDTDAKVS